MALNANCGFKAVKVCVKNSHELCEYLAKNDLAQKDFFLHEIHKHASSLYELNQKRSSEHRLLAHEGQNSWPLLTKYNSTKCHARNIERGS